MCGVTGILKTGSSLTVDEDVLTAMRDAMIHRGPDGAGNWISNDKRVGLGHRRLSIIDLSDGASQPMSDVDEKVWISFNGEIYNHRKLRNELKNEYKFKTHHSDTEVLILGYLKWGLEGLLARIEGDFAFAIWDTDSEILSLARDRTGVKPLYFYSDDEQFLFGSEIKAILSDPSVNRDIEPIAMYHYLSFMTAPAPLTMFKGIYKIPAGFYIEIDKAGSIKSKRYWDALPQNNEETQCAEKMCEQDKEAFYLNGIRSRLEASVEKRMMSDVPFGVFLSGGVDSSTNVALMSKYTDTRLNTFTVGFKDHVHLNELDYAKKISEMYGTKHHEIHIDESDMLGYLRSLIHHQDEPIADWVCVPLYFISKLAHDQGVSVVQVGEGADEQFCGYASYMGYLKLYHKYFNPFQRYLPGSMQNIAAWGALNLAKVKPNLTVYADIVDRAARNREHFWTGAMVFWDTFKKRLLNPKGDWSSKIHHTVRDSGLLPESFLEPDSFNIISSFLEPFDAKFGGKDILARMIYNEFKLRLPELLLMRVDKITMSESLEARVPFLDHNLVEFTMGIPESWKTRNGMSKYLLKRAVEDILPEEVIYRKKMGFGAPMAEWLKGDFGKICKNAVINSSLLKMNFINVDFVLELFEEHSSGKNNNSLYIWNLYNLTAWYDYWIDGKNS